MATINNIEAEQLKNGDHSIYKQLFVIWYEPLCNYASSILRSMDEAEDIVQKVFYKLWDQRDEIIIHTSVKSYLYRAVHNDCLNRIKQIKTMAEHNANYIYINPLVEDSANNKLFCNDLENNIMIAIKLLPTQCRKVFELSRMQHLSYAEIAEQLNISTNTVENHISKALKLLRENLKEFLMLLFIIIKLK